MKKKSRRSAALKAWQTIRANRRKLQRIARKAVAARSK